MKNRTFRLIGAGLLVVGASIVTYSHNVYENLPNDVKRSYVLGEALYDNVAEPGMTLGEIRVEYDALRADPTVIDGRTDAVINSTLAIGGFLSGFVGLAFLITGITYPERREQQDN